MTTRFRVSLYGCFQPLLVDVPATDIAELHELLSRSRFLPARLVEADGEPASCEALIAVQRILLIVEVVE